MKKLIVLLSILSSGFLTAQSFELMPGSERIFIDAQYLKFIDADHGLSLFSRARATSSYDSPVETDLFTGAYLNYTTKFGIGATLLGRISSNSAGIDLGVHYFKANKNFMIYALPSINLNDELLYSWFSIVRFTPSLNEKWNLYSSLELFSAFSSLGHLSSVQRLRLGFGFNSYQFGAALNLSESRFADSDLNAGPFIRLQF